MNQSQSKNNKILWWIIGGIVILAVGSLIIYQVVQNKKNSASQKPERNNNNDNNQSGKTIPLATGSPDTSEEELERYLLEKRLDLEKYFVFCLQKEVKPGNVKTNVYSNGNRIDANNGRNVVPSLANHLSKLIGEEKNWIIFQGKYTNETSKEWSEDKLDQKIKNGEEWYIIFDKSQINSEVCNYFSKIAGIGKITFPTGIVLAVEAEPEVQVKRTKKETLEFLTKNDPLFTGWDQKC